MENQLANIQKMYKVVKGGRGFDWIIVVSSNEEQARFWQERLECLRGQVIGKNTKIISQSEDWPDGAGPVRSSADRRLMVSSSDKHRKEETSNGAGKLLGTLYAWEKASKLKNLAKELKNGKKIAIYHTAGPGKRIAPLSLTEEGGKAAIRLPKLVKIGPVRDSGAREKKQSGQISNGVNHRRDFLTILEAVILSTQIFAPSREGRLCVFWGDQIMVPSKEPDFGANSHVEIFGIREKSPRSQKIWEKEWQHYGVLIPGREGGILQREKISWKKFLGFKINYLSKSLGSFSTSLPFLKSLLDEFGRELKQKRGSLDTDFHLWTPLTSTKNEVLAAGSNLKYFERMARFKKRFINTHPSNIALIQDKDLGADTFWWDFGQLNLYSKNLFKTLNDNLEGKAFRKFFGLEKFWIKKKKTPDLRIENSILVNSKIKGKIKDSMVLGARVNNSAIQKTLLFNIEAPRVIGGDAMGYNVQDSLGLSLKKQDVLTDIFSKVGKIRIKTKAFRDGKKDWKEKILQNPFSYERLSQWT